MTRATVSISSESTLPGNFKFIATAIRGLGDVEVLYVGHAE